MDENYYVSRKSRLLRNLDKAVKHTKKVFVRHYGDKLTDAIVSDVRKEYENLLPVLPYIGGKQNMMTQFLVESTYCLGLYRVLKNLGSSVEEIGRIIYEIVETRLDQVPRIALPIIGKLKYGKLYLRRIKKQAAESQKRQYAGDWVFTFIEGDEREFDYGYDITECGICKFFHSQNAVEILPFICLVDFPLSKAFGRGLVRTMTLSEGAEKCDFRYKRGRETEEGWPPEFLRHKNL
jgi:hypothetical protein